MDGAQNKAYYEDFVADVYDALPTVSGRADLDFYLDCAAQARGPILELGCGTGRVLMPVAEAGHTICGLDLSAAMLAKCKAKVAALPRELQSRVKLIQADMAAFKLPDRFKLVITPFRPFQHLQSVDEQTACLHAVHEHLAPGGRLILDVFHTDAQRMHDPKFLGERDIAAEVPLPGGRKLRLAERTVAFHRAIQANDVELIHYITHADGRMERRVHAFRMRYFFRYEVEHLLACSGFRIVELFGNFDRTPLADHSPEMLFVAEKIPESSAESVRA
jgi:SAM-dependent methyltransferase